MGQGKWTIGCAALLIGVAGRPLHAQESTASATTPAEAEQRIEDTLDRRLKSPLDFPETPLNTVFTAISEEYGIPVVFDEMALEAIAQSPDTEVTVTLSDITLRSALELMLRQVDDVTYVVDNEVLLVTTEDEAVQRMEVRVYRTDNLRSPDPIDGIMNPGSSTGADFDSLIDLVISTVEPESWQENGTGEGEIQPFDDDMLVVCQTRPIHEKIDQLFENLRSTRAAILADNSPLDDDKFITRGVRVYDSSLAKDPADRDAIRDALLASAAWGSKEADLPDEAFLKVLPTRVIVRHYPHVVRQVLQTLEDLAVTMQPEPQIFSGSATDGVGHNGVMSDAVQSNQGQAAGGGGRRGGF